MATVCSSCATRKVRSEPRAAGKKRHLRPLPSFSPFRPEESPLLVDRARGGCPMGVVLDKIYPELGNVSGRLVLAEWIASGCRLPEEPTPPRHERVLPRRPRRPLLLMEQWGYGAVH